MTIDKTFDKSFAVWQQKTFYCSSFICSSLEVTRIRFEYKSLKFSVFVRVVLG